jgi:L-ascorbate metabolism protein UlaG (beta-lactamase superfamily)
VLESDAGNIYFAGDTGFGNVFASVRERFAPLRLALLPIGAYQPEWFMGPVHMTPDQAVEARRILEAATAIGIHYGTFALADDGFADPPQRLSTALAGSAEAEHFWLLPEGEGRLVPELLLEKELAVRRPTSPSEAEFQSGEIVSDFR